MAKHPPNWTKIERRYFIGVILPKSQKPIFGSDKHNPKGYTWGQLAEIMQAGIDRIYVNKPPFASPREYSASALSQHWRKRCGKLAKDTGQLDEFGPKSPVLGSADSFGPPPAHASRYQAAAPRPSRKRQHRAVFEDDEEYEFTDEESTTYDEVFGNGGDDDEYVPTRKEKPVQPKKAKKTISSSAGKGGGLQRRVSGGYDQKTSAILEQFRASYLASARAAGVRPKSSGQGVSRPGRDQFSRMNEQSTPSYPLSSKHTSMTGDQYGHDSVEMRRGSAQFYDANVDSPLSVSKFSEPASMTGVRQHGDGRAEMRRGSAQFNDPNIDPRLSISKYSEPATTAGVQSNEHAREEKRSDSRYFDLTQKHRDMMPPNQPYSRPTSTRGIQIYGNGTEQTRREHGTTYDSNGDSHSSSPNHGAWAGVMARANEGVSLGESHFDTMEVATSVARGEHTDAAGGSEVYSKSNAFQTTQTINRKLEEWQQPDFDASTSAVQSKRGNAGEIHSQNTSELAYREDTASPPFEVRPLSSSAITGKRPYTSHAGETVAINKNGLQPTVQSEDDEPSLESRPVFAPARISNQKTSADASALQKLGRMRKRSPSAPPVNKVNFNPYHSNPFFEDDD